MLIFCEYVILEQSLDAFRAWAKDHPALWTGVQLLENTDQPGVILEIRPARDEHNAENIQKERLGRRSEWAAMEKWVKGGRSGIRIWKFRPYFNE